VRDKTVRLDSARRRGGDAAGQAGDLGRYRVVIDTPEVTVLRRGPGDSPRVLMAGEIVDPSTVLEVINAIAASRWVGTLRIEGADARRILGFARGALRHAKSDNPEDRLDKILTRAEMLGPAKVEAAMRDIRADQRLGEALVERGVITRQQLFGFLQKQMEEILLAAVLETEGWYLFTVGGDGEPPDTSGHVQVQHLLLTAAERVDSLALYRRLIPDLGMCPVVEPGVKVDSLAPRERLVVGYATGERSIAEIASETWLGRYQTTETVYRLLRAGRLRLAPRRRTVDQLAAETVAPFNALLRDIYETVDGRGDGRRVRREVVGWAGGGADREAVTECLDGEGLLDVALVAAHLAGPAAERRAETLRGELHELTANAQFTASLWLPREIERELSGRVHEGLKGL
jgi:hypothetical protein